MRVSFLVLLASLSLSAVLAETPGKRKEHEHSSSFVNDAGFQVEQSGKTVVSENSEVSVVQVGDVIHEEETITIRHSTQGKRKGKRKKENVESVPVHIPCDELLVSEKNECMPTAENQVCNFNILSEDNCAFECKCEATVQEVIEEVVEEQVDGFGVNLVKNKRRRKKEGAEAGEGKKRRKQAGGKECAGEKKLSWQNCLIKMKGLIAWGENTANFDEKFDSLK